MRRGILWAPLGLVDLADGGGGLDFDPGLCAHRFHLPDPEDHRRVAADLLPHGNDCHLDDPGGGDLHHREHPLLSEHARELLFSRPLVYVFAAIPVLGLGLVAALLRSLQLRQEVAPIVYTFLIFALSFIGLGFLIFPHIIPPSITIYQAAAAPSTLVFMLTFVGFLIPIVLGYNIYNYVVFRGKIGGRGNPKQRVINRWC